ncbi:hypothetical protein HDU97_006672 [Phlyctochytrium planicorne]|nr:hypothetical protein HDU97_006672 [Phlyctochytrium planicorne]
MGKYSRQPGKAAPIDFGPPSKSPDSSLWIEFPLATNDSTYLQMNIAKQLTEGITHVIMTKPRDPIDALGRYLVELDERRIAAEELARRQRDQAIASMPTLDELKTMQSRFKRSIWARAAAKNDRAALAVANDPLADRVSTTGHEEEDRHLNEDDGIPYAVDTLRRGSKGENFDGYNRYGSLATMGPPASTTPPFSPPVSKPATEAATKNAGRATPSSKTASLAASRATTHNNQNSAAAAPSLTLEGEETPDPEGSSSLGVKPATSQLASRAITPVNLATDAIDERVAPARISLEDLNHDRIQNLISEPSDPESNPTIGGNNEVFGLSQLDESHLFQPDDLIPGGPETLSAILDGGVEAENYSNEVLEANEEENNSAAGEIAASDDISPANEAEAERESDLSPTEPSDADNENTA